MNLSIIVPVYNRQHTIKQTLEASKKAVGDLTAQWIVVDDGSTDQTAEIAGNWKNHQSDSDIRIIRRENRGAAAARNTGMTHATGENILFLDSDDQLLPDWLPNAVRELDHNDIDICYTGYRIVDGGGQIMRTSQAFSEAKALQGVLTTWVTHPDAIVYRSSFLNEVGGFREDMPAMQDHEFTLRAFLQAGKIKRLRGYGVDVRDEGADRISAARFSKSQPDVIAFLRETVTLLKNQNLWSDYLHHWQTRCESYIYQFLRHGQRREAAKVAEVLRNYADQSAVDKGRFEIARILPAGISALWFRKTSRKIW